VALITSDKTWRPGDGFEAGMEMLDGPTETAHDFIPTLDQDAPVASYTDWRKEDTRIVTCRIANDVYPGERFDTREEAHRAITRRHGKILEANYTPGRAFFRVRKPEAK
jgi:hypothetical protein